VGIMNPIELVRSQMSSLKGLLDDAVIKKAADELDKKLIDLESHLYELRLTGAQDSTRWGPQLISDIQYLAEGLASADFKPTAQQTEMQKLQESRLKTYQTQAEVLLNRDLGAFNEVLRERKLPNIIARVP
jgi:hypothetical protein